MSAVRFARFSRSAGWITYFCEVTLDGATVREFTGRLENGQRLGRQSARRDWPTAEAAADDFERTAASLAAQWPEQERGERPSARTAFLSHPMEQAVREGTASPEATAVYLDWLMSSTDPRGPLVIAAERGPAAAFEYLREHDWLLGPAHALLGEQLALGPWRDGLLRGLTVGDWRRRPTRLSEVLALAAAEPLFSFVTELTVGAPFTREDWQVLATSWLPRLRRLAVRFGGPGAAAPLLATNGRADLCLELSQPGLAWFEALRGSVLVRSIQALEVLAPEVRPPQAELEAAFGHLRWSWPDPW